MTKKSKSIEWNDKGQMLLSPLQRDAFERGEEPRRLEGKLYADDDGHVWLDAAGHKKLVGEGGKPTPAEERPGAQNAPTEQPAPSDAQLDWGADEPKPKRAGKSKRKRK